MREIGDFRSGFIRLAQDNETLELAERPSTVAHAPGIHVPVELHHSFGRLFVKFLITKDYFLAGNTELIGRGVLLPFNGGIRLHSAENREWSMLDIPRIREIMDVEIWVNLVFRRER